jgi:hypothetical protein
MQGMAHPQFHGIVALTLPKNQVNRLNLEINLSITSSKVKPISLAS